MQSSDPLWTHRHAIVGVALALVISVVIAAFAGRWAGDWLDGDYGTRVAVYAGLLLYLVVGAVVLFMRVARHETQALSLPRLGLWLASLWAWPLLVRGQARKD